MGRKGHNGAASAVYGMAHFAFFVRRPFMVALQTQVLLHKASLLRGSPIRYHSLKYSALCVFVWVYRRLGKQFYRKSNYIQFFYGTLLKKDTFYFTTKFKIFLFLLTLFQHISNSITTLKSKNENRNGRKKISFQSFQIKRAFFLNYPQCLPEVVSLLANQYTSTGTEYPI